MVREGNTLLFCGTNPIPMDTNLSARLLVMFLSSKVTFPLRTLTRPNRDFSSVDLPAPFGPMMPTNSPDCAYRSHPLRMFTPGKYPAMTSSIRTSAPSAALR